MVLVVAPIASTLHRTKLCKLLLPIAQHMWLNSAKIAYFTNREIALCGNRWQQLIDHPAGFQVGAIVVLRHDMRF